MPPLKHRDWTIRQSEGGDRFTAFQAGTNRTSPSFPTEPQVKDWIDRGATAEPMRPTGKRK